MEIRSRVREVRAIVGKGELSQKQLAEMAGIDPSTLSDIENHRTKPTVETGLALARALGTPVEELFVPADTDDASVDSPAATSPTAAGDGSVTEKPATPSTASDPTDDRATAVERP